MAREKAKTAVLLLAFGGPASPDEIGPFMTKLTGRTPAPATIERVAARYKAIGGGSPLPRIVSEQAAALAQALAGDGAPLVQPAFKYAEPSIARTVVDLAGRDFTRIIGISLSPHYSRISTGAYFEELHKATEGTALEVHTVDGYHAQPSFLDTVAANTRRALAKLEGNQEGEVQIVFTAHSLPVEYVEQGDPYVDQLNETIAGIVERVPGYAYHLGYQSRGMGEGQWLSPEVGDVLEGLAARGLRRVALVPLSFTCDHVETLYDIDVTIAEKARTLGISLSRAAVPNISSLFIDALAAVVRPHLVNGVGSRE